MNSVRFVKCWGLILIAICATAFCQTPSIAAREAAEQLRKDRESITEQIQEIDSEIDYLEKQKTNRDQDLRKIQKEIDEECANRCWQCVRNL